MTGESRVSRHAAFQEKLLSVRNKKENIAFFGVGAQPQIMSEFRVSRHGALQETILSVTKTWEDAACVGGCFP